MTILFPIGTGVGYLCGVLFPSCTRGSHPHENGDFCAPWYRLFQVLGIAGLVLTFVFCFLAEPNRGQAEGPQTRFHRFALKVINQFIR